MPLDDCPEIDNQYEALKVALRKRFLPVEAKVLDLYCGSGVLYNSVYKGCVRKYVGVDKDKIHDSALCTLMDNESFIGTLDISTFNVFDLDAYGCPWKLIYRILERHNGQEIYLFVTDGLKTNLFGSYAGTGELSEMVLATEGISRKFKIPCMGRWYEEMFCTMLSLAEDRYGWTFTTAYHVPATKGVSYWFLKVEKNT